MLRFIYKSLKIQAIYGDKRMREIVVKALEDKLQIILQKYYFFNRMTFYVFRKDL